MNGMPQVVLEGRRLALFAGSDACLTLSLDEGGRHRLVVADSAGAQMVVDALERCPAVGVLPGSGGLLGAMTVAENFALALRYHVDRDDPRDWEQDLEIALRRCGLPAQRVATLGRERPMDLARAQRWTLGFARWLLRPPDLLVFDRVFAGLARRQADALIAVEAIYHQRHPFRPVLFVDLDSHELPELPDCRSSIFLGEVAEPQ
jgi:ABC-type transporter Mla maintaining outer membrane lipid asymmetry ATPase subunit MlaF